MDCRFLTGEELDLSDYRVGAPQQAGLLTVVPITTTLSPAPFLPPPGLETTASGAKGGPVLLKNDSTESCVLAPLHIGLPVSKGGGLMLSSAALAPPSERRDLSPEIAYPYRLPRRAGDDPSIGSVLPLALRGPAWLRRGARGAALLAATLNQLQGQLRRQNRKILPSVLSHPDLRSLPCRIELIAGQTGALFFIEDRPVGLEIAPSPACFQAIWRPLLVECYGLTALLREYDSPRPARPPEPYVASSLAELRTELFRARHLGQERLMSAVSARSAGAFAVEAGQRWRNFRVHSLTGMAFGGQYIEETLAADPESESGMPKMLRNLFRKGSGEEKVRKRVVYASLFALGPNPRSLP